MARLTLMLGGCNGWRRVSAVTLTMLSVLLLATISVSGADAQSIVNPRFSLPIDCEIGVSCFVQNYVDRDPSEGHAPIIDVASSATTNIKGPTFASVTWLPCGAAWRYWPLQMASLKLYATVPKT